MAKVRLSILGSPFIKETLDKYKNKYHFDEPTIEDLMTPLYEGLIKGISSRMINVLVHLVHNEKPIRIKELTQITGISSRNAMSVYIDRLLRRGFVVKNDDNTFSFNPKYSALEKFIYYRFTKAVF